MCNGTGLYKIWLIASADNSQVFWVLSAVCFVGSNLGSSDLWPVQPGTSTFQLALYSTDYWFPFKMWRPSHSDHNLLINVSSSSSPAVVITTIRKIEHSGTTLSGSLSFSLRPVSFPLFLSRFLIMSPILLQLYECVCVSWQEEINIRLHLCVYHLYLRENVECMCRECPGQYCNLSPLNHTMAGSVTTAKLVKAIILIRGGAEQPNMLSGWVACRNLGSGVGVGVHAVYWQLKGSMKGKDGCLSFALPLSFGPFSFVWISPTSSLKDLAVCSILSICRVILRERENRIMPVSAHPAAAVRRPSV